MIRPTMSVTVTRDRIPGIVASVEELTRTQVLVGIPAANTGRDPVEGAEVDNATLGYVHEHGSPDQNIPARPWLVPGVQNALPRVEKRLLAGARAAVDGRQDEVERQLEAIGLETVSSVQNKLRDGPFAPLSPRTLAARRARGVTRTKPLIDTAQMLKSVTYVLRRLMGRGRS